MRNVSRVAVAFLFGVTIVAAQNQPSSYFRTACIKVQPGKWSEFMEFSNGMATKVMQAAAENGEFSTATLLRSVLPSGEEARCDFISVTSYRGAPPAPLTREQLQARIEKAGIGITGDQFAAKRDVISRLVSQEIWRSVISIGDIQKGDYMFVNFGRTSNMQNYLKFEDTVWKPMAEQWIKEGRMRAWRVNQLVLPAGTEVKYQITSVDVFPSWDAVFTPLGLQDMMKKIHPDRDYAQTVGEIPKIRDLARRELYVVQNRIVAPATRSSNR